MTLAPALQGTTRPKTILWGDILGDLWKQLGVSAFKGSLWAFRISRLRINPYPLAFTLTPARSTVSIMKNAMGMFMTANSTSAYWRNSIHPLRTALLSKARDTYREINLNWHQKHAYRKNKQVWSWDNWRWWKITSRKISLLLGELVKSVSTKLSLFVVVLRKPWTMKYIENVAGDQGPPPGVQHASFWWCHYWLWL